MKRKAVPGKTLYFLRALFPSWRFFEDFDGESALLLRLGDASGNFTAWQRCLPRAERRIHHLFFNPQTNYLLAAGSLLQQLLSEIDDLERVDDRSIENLVSYRLTRKLVETKLARLEGGPISGRYQFKISSESEDWLVSPIYEIQKEAQ